MTKLKVQVFAFFDGGPAKSQVSQHIPDKGFQLVRYYGWYSNKARGVRVKTGAAQAEETLLKAMSRIVRPPRPSGGGSSQRSERPTR